MELVSEPSGIFSTCQPHNIHLGCHKGRRIISTMATCHSLRVIDGQVLGDPLDIKMFQFTGWIFEVRGGASADQPVDRGDVITPSIARPPPSDSGYFCPQHDDVGLLV